MQIAKLPQMNNIHTAGISLSVVDMLNRTFTKEKLHLNQLKHKQLPPQMAFYIIKNDEITTVKYLVKHESI